MDTVMETMPFSKLRDSLPSVLEIVRGDNPVVLTHHGNAEVVMISKERWNFLAGLFSKYEELYMLEKRSSEMKAGEFHTLEEVDRIVEGLD